MANWSDVADKALDFLKNPNALGFGIIISMLLFLGYIIPLGVVTWTSWDNTSRQVQASKDNTDRLEKALTVLNDNFVHSIASARKP